MKTATGGGRSRGRGVRRTAAQRQEVVEQFGRSGLSQAEFRRREGLHPVTLSRWLREPRRPMAFAQVVLSAEATREIEVRLPNGVVVHVTDAAPVEDLAAWIRRVAGC